MHSYINQPFKIIILSVLMFIASVTYASKNSKTNTNTLEIDADNLYLPYKLVTIDHPVYKVLEYFELRGILASLPQARPYTRYRVVAFLEEVHNCRTLNSDEYELTEQYLADFYGDVVGLKLITDQKNDNFTMLGANLQVNVGLGFGDNGTYSTSNLAEGFIAGDLGQHITYSGSIGLGIERLAPDLFHQSYVKDGAFHSPYESVGYGEHPYQFNYESMWAHVNISGTSGESTPFQRDLTAALIYRSELSGSWYNNALRISYHNQRRSLGYGLENLNLSSTARRFSGIDIVVEPVPWFRYTLITGSLFSYANQRSSYRQSVYEYDLGEVQKMLTIHLLELNLGKYVQLSATGGNIWSKRLELAYLMPMVLPHFSQIEVGDHDNLSLSLGASFSLPYTGKFFAHFWLDEMAFYETNDLFKQPRNRYAFQVGWKSALPSMFLPCTTGEIRCTRITPFAYTHYPESNFNPLGTERPLDMTYTHDEFNLGFNLPPNSREWLLALSNHKFHDLTIQWNNRFISHGTNDLAGDTYQIFGDIYRHQTGNVNEYPLMNFGNDGFYDRSWISQLRAEKKMRNVKSLVYYTIYGQLGYSLTLWNPNKTQITPPGNQSLFTLKFGVKIEL